MRASCEKDEGREMDADDKRRDGRKEPLDEPTSHGSSRLYQPPIESIKVLLLQLRRGLGNGFTIYPHSIYVLSYSMSLMISLTFFSFHANGRIHPTPDIDTRI